MNTWTCYCCGNVYEWPLPCTACSFAYLQNGKTWGCARHGKPEKP